MTVLHARGVTASAMALAMLMVVCCCYNPIGADDKRLDKQLVGKECSETHTDEAHS